MTKTRVANASPTILLGKIGQLALLREPGTRLVLPRTVANEIVAGPAHDPARLWLSDPGQGFIQPDPPINPTVASWDLGAGETCVLSFCLENPGSLAILDDGAARDCARTLNIPVTGTLGVLMQAKKTGRISELAPWLDQLLENGFRIDAVTLRFVLDWDNETR